jgi:hypothetical protein
MTMKRRIDATHIAPKKHPKSILRVSNVGPDDKTHIPTVYRSDKALHRWRRIVEVFQKILANDYTAENTYERWI